MDIKRMHAEIKLRWNKINSNHKKDFPAAFLDDFLDDAQNEFLEICYSGNNTKKFRLGFEATEQRMDMLSSLVIPEEATTPSLFSSGVYKINLQSLTKPYKHFVRGTVTTSCGKIPISIERHNDLDTKLRDENTKPSQLWRRCLGVLASNTATTGESSLYLYTGGDFTITGANIDFIKIPRKMYFGGYDTYEYTNGDTTFPNTGDATISCEFPKDVHTFIVDIAVQLIARSVEDTNKLQIVEDKLIRTI